MRRAENNPTSRRLRVYDGRGASRKHSTRRIQSILNTDDSDAQAALAKAGGTSLAGVIISVAVTLALVWIVSFYCMWPFLQTVL